MVTLSGALIFGLRLRQSNHPLALFELPALLHKLDALESLQHATFGFDRALALQAWMLTHGAQKMDQIAGKATQNREQHLRQIVVHQPLGKHAWSGPRHVGESAGAPGFHQRQEVRSERRLKMSSLHNIIRRSPKENAFYLAFSQRKGRDDASDGDSQSDEEL
jgi:hypothetical protein